MLPKEYHTWNVTIARPDLIVDDITISPSSPTVGENVTITAKLKNRGNGDAVRTFYINYLVDDVYIGSDTISGGLDAGDPATETIPYLEDTPGEHRISVHVDSGNDIPEESDEGNNWRHEVFTWGQPDLIVDDISISPSSPTVGENVTITAKLKNRGNGDALRTFYANCLIDDVYIGTVEVSGGLGADSSATRTLTHVEGAPGEHRISVHVDSGNDIPEESDEGNNWRHEAHTWGTPQHEFFDDFVYTHSADPTLLAFGWTFTGEGLGDGTWPRENVVFLTEGGTRIMRLIARTGGDQFSELNALYQELSQHDYLSDQWVGVYEQIRAITVPASSQAGIESQAARFLEGTYVARVRLSSSPETYEDRTIQTFFLLNQADPYGECDFEYLAHAPLYKPWDRGAGLYKTTYEYCNEHDCPCAYDPDSVTAPREENLYGWHLLILVISDGTVRYYVDGVSSATHGGPFYPDITMHMCFYNYFHVFFGSSVDQREHMMDVDWVYHAKDMVLSAASVESIVDYYRFVGVDRKDSLPECLTDVHCNDENACTDDACVGGSCDYTNNTDSCDDGMFCTATDLCSGGACLGSGNPCPEVCDEANDVCVDCLTGDDCDDANSCTDDTCVSGSCDYTDNTDPCDDGMFCTATDVCSGGTCSGTGNRCPGQLCDEVGDRCVDCLEDTDCDDGIGCTINTCNDTTGECEYPVEVGSCLIDDVCYSEGATKPDSECEGCRPSENATDWSPLAEGTGCGDPADTVCDNPDTCDGQGVCQPNHEPDTTECRVDAGDCDVPEYCDGAGTCPEDSFEPPGTACGDPTNDACTDPDTCDGQGACLGNNEPNGTSCEDGLFCNGMETCSSGTCVDGPDPCPGVCNEDNDSCPCGQDSDCVEDELPCTTVRCNQASGWCEWPVDSGNCLIAGLCYGDGDTSLGNDCLVCDSLTSVDAWTPALIGTACGDDSDTICTDPDTCDGSGTCLPNHAPDGTSCEDDLFCNGADACSNGACASPGDPCDPGWVCNEDSDVCECDDAGDCDDGDSCTADSCVDGSCVHSAIDPCCGDGTCGGGETCSSCPQDCGSCPEPCPNGTCGPGEDPCNCPQDCGQPPTSEVLGSTCDDDLDNDCDGQMDCDDEDCQECTEDFDCDDGRFCNGTEVCVECWCGPGTSPCANDECCDEAADTCTPGRLCTSDAGCDDGDPCTVDTCVDGCCVNTPDCLSSGECDDGDPCTINICDQGCCTYEPECDTDADCGDGDPCTVDSCDDGCCENTTIICPNNQVCADGECVWTLAIRVRVDEDSDGDGEPEAGDPFPLQDQHYGDGVSAELPVPDPPCDADELCVFMYWAGDDVPAGHETDDPLTLMLDTNKSVMAVFQVVSCIDHADCDDDGRYCNGSEQCVEGECLSAGDPCAEGQICDEALDLCCRPGLCGAGCGCTPGAPAVGLIFLGLMGMRFVGPCRRTRGRR